MCIKAFGDLETHPCEPELDLCLECGAFSGEHIPGCPGELLPIDGEDEDQL